MELYDACESFSNYSATSNNMKLVHWPMMGGLLHFSEEGTGRGRRPPTPLLAVPNVTARPINGQCTNNRIALWFTCGPQRVKDKINKLYRKLT